MNGPLAIAGIGLGVKAIGAALGGGGKNLPDWYMDMLRTEAERDRSSGFLPDRGAYDEALQSQLAEFTAQLPVGEEAFNTDLASRGIYRAGEAPKEMYRSVYAPIARAGNRAITESHLAYTQAYQRGMIAADASRSQYMALLGNALGGQQSFGQRMGGTFGELGDFGMQYGMLGVMGFFDEGTDLDLFGNSTGG